MNNKFIAITILVLLGLAQADPNAGLVAHYPFAGDYSDATGNHADATNSGSSWSSDRNDNANSALFFNGNTQVVEIPQSTVNGLVDYTLSFWMKSSQPQNGANTMVSWSHPLGQSKEYLFLFQRFVGISSEFYNWSRKQYYLNNYISTGNWQHYVFTRDSANKKYHIYVDGQLFETLDSAILEDGYQLDVTAFILGNHQYGTVRGGYSEFFQYYGSIHDFRIYNRAFTAADAAEVRDAPTNNAPEPTDPQTCVDYLATLEPGVITEDLTFPLNTDENEYYHHYEISLNAFTWDSTCFESQLWLGGGLLDHEVVDNKIVITFPWKDAAAWGCDEQTPTQQQCNFQLQIYWDGNLQHQKLFTSTVTTPDLENLSQELSLNVINDEDESLKSFDQTLDTQLKFCADLQCSSYATPNEIIRNTDVYVEFKVNTPGYNQYYPIHRTFSLDGFDVEIQNQAAIDSWAEQGRIIYHFRPPFASPDALLAIGISISQTNPNRRRMLQQQQEGGSGGDLEQSKDNVGKYIRVSVVEENNSDKKEKKEDSDNTGVYIAIIAAAVVLVVSLAGIAVYFKLKKPSPSNASSQSNQQLQQNSNSSPRSNEENKLNIEVQ